MEHNKKNFIEAGIPLQQAGKALIMLHGRGADARDILSLIRYLTTDDYYIVAPEATGGAWYPHGFMAPLPQNEPWLGSALDFINEIIMNINKAGIPAEKIVLLGFSQGACLALEFAARNARKWRGVVAFTGGLIGEKIDRQQHKGDFEGTKIFIGNSDNDPHVPLTRSQDSSDILKQMGAIVTLKVYPGMPHTINEDEINEVNQMIL
ncbi:MAG: dienelactone hydrolase family protein [Bacteroidia bacterium]